MNKPEDEHRELLAAGLRHGSRNLVRYELGIPEDYDDVPTIKSLRDWRRGTYRGEREDAMGDA